MNSANAPLPPGRGDESVSRRTAVFELTGIALVLAIPVGAMLATANPIPDPPHRRTLNDALQVDLPTDEQQEPEAEDEKRRSSTKQREAKNRRGSQQPARDESHAVSADEEAQSADVEQRASRS